MLTRLVIGAFAAAGIAIAAHRARSLSTSGAVAAVLVGTLASAAGMSWAFLLISYFVISTALSRLGRAEKERRTSSFVAKGGARDARQVLSNGGVFALGAIAILITGDRVWAAFALGGLAASAADTWATEIGTLYGREPRSIVSFRPMAPGESGGVTAIGSVAMLAGAAFVAFCGYLLHWDTAVIGGAFVAGVAGAVIDSLLGATMQTRRWCEVCGRGTERDVHDCGARTRTNGGVGSLDNDTVNLASTIAGGLLAMLLVR